MLYEPASVNHWVTMPKCRCRMGQADDCIAQTRASSPSPVAPQVRLLVSCKSSATDFSRTSRQVTSPFLHPRAQDPHGRTADCLSNWTTAFSGRSWGTTDSPFMAWSVPSHPRRVPIDKPEESHVGVAPPSRRPGHPSHSNIARFNHGTLNRRRSAVHPSSK